MLNISNFTSAFTVPMKEIGNNKEELAISLSKVDWKNQFFKINKGCFR
jgi:hypothetical protein